MLRCFGIHPIVWSTDRFVVSGYGFVCLHCLFAIYWIQSTLALFLMDGSDLPLIKVSTSPIGSNMRSLRVMLGVLAYLMSLAYVIAFVRGRARVAVVFNELNSLWLT